jgi:hypothetical protein
VNAPAVDDQRILSAGGASVSWQVAIALKTFRSMTQSWVSAWAVPEPIVAAKASPDTTVAVTRAAPTIPLLIEFLPVANINTVGPEQQGGTTV